jgi:hypothetical protein
MRGIPPAGNGTSDIEVATADSGPSQPAVVSAAIERHEGNMVGHEFEQTPRGKPMSHIENLYDSQNPQLAALLSKLPGTYHSDRTAGFHRSPRIDNSGPQPAMLINGRVVFNLLLDCGVEAVITGNKGVVAMGITPSMIRRRAIVIRTATGALTERLDRTKEPVSFTLNPGTADEVTIMAHVVIADHELPDTLIDMSVIGPLGLDPSFRKK